MINNATNQVSYEKVGEYIPNFIFNDVSILDLVERGNTLQSSIPHEKIEMMHKLLTKSLESHMLNAYVEIHNHSENTSNNSNRDLLGYNVYRDGQEIGYTENTFYDDSNVTPGIEYCYTVVAVYDEGESSPSNEDCATATTPPNPVFLSVDDLSIGLGENGDIDVSMSNDDPVAGFQFIRFFCSVTKRCPPPVMDRTPT